MRDVWVQVSTNGFLKANDGQNIMRERHMSKNVTSRRGNIFRERIYAVNLHFKVGLRFLEIVIRCVSKFVRTFIKCVTFRGYILGFIV